MNHLLTKGSDRPATIGGVLHVCIAGRSFDMSMPGLHLSSQSSNQQVTRAVAEYLEVPSYQLDDYVIDRHANGNFTIRPQAVFA